jgi:hypothetical protein
MRSLRNTERVLMNEGVKRVIEIERAKGDALKIDDIHEQVAGIYPKVMIDGDMEAGAWSCGMVAGLIHDVPSCKDLIDRIMAEAHQLIAERLARFGPQLNVGGASPMKWQISEPFALCGPDAIALVDERGHRGRRDRGWHSLCCRCSCVWAVPSWRCPFL